MKISTILDHIDNGHMALPEFQRGTVALASQAGFRCFTEIAEFQKYVTDEILTGEVAS